MMDREKVIKGLECCTTAIGCYECPYAVGGKATNACNLLIDRDALALLKAQEPVVHGRWVDEKGNPVPWCDALPSSPAYSCWCNQCGTWLVASDEYPVYGLFCPACGAKMDGEANECREAAEGRT